MNVFAYSSLLLCATLISASAADGIAQAFHHDLGLEKHPQVLFFDNFENEQSVLKNDGRSIVAAPGPLHGKYVMASHNRQGKHLPWDTHHPVKQTEIIHYRFYSMFESGYEMGGGVKGPGVSANAQGEPGGKAGIKPKGDDRYSARVCFNSKAEPYVYYYHMDMGQWGSNANQNIGTPISMVPGQWYCIEMMLKPNTPALKDGEIKLWINGELKVHKQEIRWRTVSSLQCNWINHSAYFGGSWTSPKDQIRFEDNIVAASTYIGPAGNRDKRDQNPDSPAAKEISAEQQEKDQQKKEQTDLLHAAYDSYLQRLHAELDHQLDNSKQLYFTYNMLHKEILIKSKSDKGYSLRSGNSDISLDIWKTFTQADATSLAIALSKSGKEEANVLAAYFVTVTDGPGAATKYLNKSGTKASEIKDLIK